ncbi:MAG: nucleoside phosphorylase [Halodesulfurarchaeum sp.]
MAADSDAPDEQYHLGVRPGDLAETVLLPGNPGRIDTITQFWDRAAEKAHHREYRTVTGEYDGTPLSATSTGIGSPSAAIAVEELARAGADTLIRVGSTGAIQPEIAIGDLLITSGAVRQEGTSGEYVCEDYPALADREVTGALVAAAERLGYDYHVGVTMSADSFYAGQGRSGFAGFRAAESEGLLEELREANVKNIEMEASVILTLGTLYDLRAGAICAVYANRSTGEFRTEGDDRAAETASLAARLLAKMDRVKAEAGVEYWHPGLSIE